MQAETQVQQTQGLIWQLCQIDRLTGNSRPRSESQKRQTWPWHLAIAAAEPRNQWSCLGQQREEHPAFGGGTRVPQHPAVLCPTATSVPNPCPNSIPQQRGFMRSCGTLIFSYWVLLVKMDKPKRFPQRSEFTVFQETLTPTQGDEEAKAPSFGITHCSCIQTFSTLRPVSDIPLLQVERKTLSKKPKEWWEQQLCKNDRRIWGFQPFSVFPRYIVFGIVTGTDGMSFFFELYSLYSLPSWADLKMCVRLPFVALCITALG